MSQRPPSLAPKPERTDEGRLDFGSLRGIVGFHIARAAVTTHGAFEQHLGRPYGLRKVEFSLLMLLLANPRISPKPLARALRVTAPKLTHLLDGLEQRGLLLREPNPQDGRSHLVRLTEDGEHLARRAEAASGPMEAELRAGLSPAEHAMLIELLGKLVTRAAP
jgi:MarR family transcriptional regulator for hemolysin